jgi:hypothetical protein
MLRRLSISTASVNRLSHLACSLARPVSRGWLSLKVADAALLLALDREPDAGDILDTWHRLRAALRQELDTLRRHGHGQGPLSS